VATGTESNGARLIDAAPIAVPVLCFSLGIAADACYMPPWPWLFAGAGVSAAGLVVFFGRSRPRMAFWLALATAVGALHHAAAVRVLSPDHLARLVAEPVRQVELTGVVVRAPVTRRDKETYPFFSRQYIYTYFTVEARRLSVAGQTAKVNGPVQVNLGGIHDRFRPGMELRLKGNLAPAKPYLRWPGILRAEPRLSGTVPVRMTIASTADITVVDQRKNPLARGLDELRRAAAGLMISNQTDTAEGHSLVSAMVLGQRYEVEESLNRAFQAAGGAHLLAVSGFHLGVLAFAAWAVAIVLNLSRRSAALIVLIVVWAFVGVNELRPPILRAAITATFAAVAVLARRPVSSLNWVAAAALILLLISPEQLFDVGFQLSFVSLIGLMLLQKPIYLKLFGSTDPVWDRRDPPSRLSGAANCLLDMGKRAAAVSLAAWMGSLPIVMHHFGTISLISPLTSVLLAIPATLLIACGFVQLVLTVVFGQALLLPSVTAWLSWLMAKAVSALAAVPGVSLDVAPPPVLWTIGYYGVLAWIVTGDRPTVGEMLMTSGLRDRLEELLRPRPKMNAVLALVGIYATWWLVSAAAAPSGRGGFGLVVVANRGDGQLVAIAAGRQTLLVDAGVGRPGEAVELVRELRARHLASPPAVFLTFPEQRFFNDLPALHAEYPDLQTFAGPAFEAVRDRYEPVESLFQTGVLSGDRMLEAGSAVEFEGVKVTPLWPDRAVAEAALALPQRPVTIRGVESLRALCELGAMYLVESEGQRLIVASMVSPIACERIRQDRPELTVDAVVISGRNEVGAALEVFLRSLAARRLIVCGPVKPSLEGWYQRISEESGLTVTMASRGWQTIDTNRD